MRVFDRAQTCPPEGASLEAILRQLLTELRPDSGGPLGWRCDERAPAGAYAGSPAAVRVQTSVVCPAILPGAFQRAPRATAGALAADRVAYVARLDAAAGATLLWLQRYGTLVEGVTTLCRTLAAVQATAAEAARWGTTAEQRREGARAHGERLVRAAGRAWWGT